MLRTARCLLVLLGVSVLVGSAFGGDLGPDRALFRSILKNVSNDVGKNFYDAKLKGLDWKAAVDEARLKIDSAGTVNEMAAAVFQLLEKLDDSHTFFVPPPSAIEARYGFDAKPFGDEVRVSEVERGGAAEAAGLQVGDRIHQINGYEVDRETGHKLLVFSRKLYQVSPLNLLVQRPGTGVLTISVVPKLKKSAVVLNRWSNYSALWSLALDDYEEWSKKYGAYRYGVEKGVGYFQIRQFPNEGEDFLTGLAEKTRDSNAIIIDLRDSPGGTLNTLLAFAGLFQTSEGEMATEVGRAKSEPMKIKPRRPYLDKPLFVLVDSTTASASEMLARHLQKTRKAKVIGDRTAGAVTTAQFFEGSVGASMVTHYGATIGVGRVVFADGEELEKKGITPDVMCVPTAQDMKDGKDPCLSKAFALAAGTKEGAAGAK